MKKKKDVGIIIKFDNKEYSKEETIILYKRFIEIFAEAKNVKIPKNLIKVFAECIIEGNSDNH